MRKTLHTIIFLFSTAIAFSQAGNTIAEAVEIADDNDVTIGAAFDGLNASTLEPFCFGATLDPKIDLYYYNLIDPDHDKINISMTTDIGIVARIHYQVLRAAGGDLNNLTEVACDFYDINPPTGGSLNMELPDESFPNGLVSNTDKYYLRIFEPTDQLNVGLDQAAISAVLSNTTVALSSFDSNTLSINQNNVGSMKYIMDHEVFKLINNNKFYNYEIYGIDGKLIKEQKNTKYLESINVSYLNKGIYILRLNGNENFKTIKFCKS